MLILGTALRPSATRVMLLGSGELGKEVAIECQRLGLEVIAVDRYADAPAMHVAHRSHVINMLGGDALRAVIEHERPDFIVPEIEAIATSMLVELEQQGHNVVPCAEATRLTAKASAAWLPRPWGCRPPPTSLLTAKAPSVRP